MFTVSTSFSLDRGRIERMLRLPGGLVYRNMERRARRVEAEAINRAPGSVGQGIRVSILRGPGGEFRGVIRSTHPASIYLVNGTRPHMIFPRRPGGVLRFTVGGRVVFARYVSHPGTQPNNWLRDALRAAL
ncbi:hypothetical protein [Streptomyces caniscabiei]|uniref:Uncharacterized protein n=1 Tax=Streptomyces caniscabiei TaxID=2746961 RepID=A0ABU4MSP8_9ACTN|nr:hypothetical protein [Streptomyces caniscabiei]MBE4788398.1 hypothetical protein [Streptomyces caniscabiei]MBE4796111.1 hypothetical protein [Streptomyces caniscabiei]MDX2944416.1 hypothetical protein [Streptomyces caniscabiei]MDX2954619.1 hypothetical protein [Streptomyces caniscabiei]MDX2986590.1 hypothetical protein [Streptomyces caniscabiei]